MLSDLGQLTHHVFSRVRHGLGVRPNGCTCFGMHPLGLTHLKVPVVLMSCPLTTNY